MSAQRRFGGFLEHDGTRLNWTIVRVPFDPVKAWPKRHRLRVRGSINGFAFRTSLFHSERLGYLLLVNKAMQRGAGAAPGSLAKIVLEPDLEERAVITPRELEKLLCQDSRLRKWHGQLSPSVRKWFADWVANPGNAETRVERAELAVERMLLAMEGERQTPPILEAAFQRQPRAREGWATMTPIQRRGHLLGIFCYQSPESRQKRALQAVAEALRIAGRAGSGRKEKAPDTGAFPEG
ncbi:MAG TPA: YdeI/OmpD-associated family protein [Acidobacteriaceae bacterium]|nr:YdeI/OmpD-associated family protein [Acidobacteriaceae bacterium]